MKLQKIRFAVQLTIFALGFTAFFHSNFKWIELGLMGLAILAGAFACGWACPFGMVQDVCSYFGHFLIKKRLKVPRSLHKYLFYLRYILAILFAYLAVYQIFYFYKYDARIIFFSVIAFNTVKIAVLAILVFFLVASMYYERLFCNYVCPYGAKMGAMSLFRIFTIKRNQQTCIQCKKCSKICPMHIDVASKNQIRSMHCNNCFKCISHCPSKHTLKFGLVDAIKIKKRAKHSK